LIVACCVFLAVISLFAIYAASKSSGLVPGELATLLPAL
jgi:hypothetical protein